MNVEIFSYSLFTTVLGMLVVFLSLSALSVMMVLLKGIFAREPARSGLEGGMRGLKKKARAGKVRAGKDEQLQASEKPPVWVAAAVAAYLAQEQEPERPTADPWNAVVNQYDPWIAGGRSGKRGV